jgi:hypothetical protein
MHSYSHNILEDVKKYDIAKIEKKAIQKSHKYLKIPNTQHLSTFTYFKAVLPDFENSSINDVGKLLENMVLFGAKGYCTYECHVYDDSLNIVATALKMPLFSKFVVTWDESFPPQYLSKTKVIEHDGKLENIHVYIEKLNPEYVFDCFARFCIVDSVTNEDVLLSSFELFFCYKNGNITVVYRDIKSNTVIACPLSEFKGRICKQK